MELTVPNISIIIGEGGSGGAIALASSNKVVMLENAIYSVISPEGCATILWRDPTKTLEASEAMKLTSSDLLKLNIIDEIIAEPVGGAHRNREEILSNVKESISKNLNFFANMSPDEILNHRKNKFLSIGRNDGFKETSNPDSLISKKSAPLKLKERIIKNKYLSIKKERIELLGKKNYEDIEKKFFLQVIDQNWKMHIQYLEQLRQVIGLRSYGNRDPLIEYKKEAFNLFENLLEKLKTDFVTIIANISIIQENNNQIKSNKKKIDPKFIGKKIGRNEPCFCGSGKKYKHCCGSL